MNFKNIKRVPKNKIKDMGYVEKLSEMFTLLKPKVKDDNATSGSLTEELIAKLWEGETITRPSEWSDDDWNTFIMNFEDFQLDDNPENLKLHVNGSEAKLVESDEIEDSRQGDFMSYSWEEFLSKVSSAVNAEDYSGHTVVSGDKAYTIEIKETEKVEDSSINEIKVGDTLCIVRGDHPGEYAEVLDIAEDGSFLLKNLRTGEEFNEPKGLFGVYVTVTDSNPVDSE